MKTQFLLAVCALTLALPCGAAPAALTVADFETSDPATIRHNEDGKVTSVAAAMTKNELDGSRAFEYTANLEGPSAGWAGCSLPVDTAGIPAGADTIEFDARATGSARSLWITIEERDSSRWNASVKLSREWKRYSVPAHKFEWFTGPPAREKTRPDFSKIITAGLWIGNKPQGAHGFAIDNTRLVDAVPSMQLRYYLPASIPVQKDTTITIEAIDPATSQPVAWSGELFLETADRNSMNFPLRAPLINGLAQIPVFPRQPGGNELYVYEPNTRQEMRVPLQVSYDGLRVNFTFEGFDNQQVIYANEIIAPKLRLEGTTTIPLSAHIEFIDHHGKMIVAKNESVANLSGGLTKLLLPQPGLFTADIKMLAESITQLPYLPDNVPAFMAPMVRKQMLATSGTMALPDGVSSSTAFGFLVHNEQLPSTATVVGHDQFPLFVTVDLPREATLYKSPFGLSSGQLFHLPMNQIGSVGNRRIRWHRRLGSRWGRNDLWWNETETSPTVFQWAKADSVVDQYKNQNLRLLGILCYASAWSNGIAPADDAARSQWRGWVSQMFKHFGNRVIAYEVWNEPNGAFWKPLPNPDHYRELLQATHEELKKISTTPRIVAGATAGFDPVFFDQTLSDGFNKYADIISMHPYPERPAESPEDNYLTEDIEGFRAVMNRYKYDEGWITEIGWPTTPSGVDEITQANYLVRAYTMALSRRMSKVFWFDLLDWERYSWRQANDAHLGIMDVNYRPKPSSIAYNIALFMLTETKSAEKTQQGQAVIHTFDIQRHSVKWEGRLHLAWTPREGDVEHIKLPLAARGGVFALDYLGAEQMPEVIEEITTSGTTTLAGAVRPDAITNMAMIPTMYNDMPTTKICQFRVTHEPLYIWDVGTPPSRRK
ncbi:MAG: carbohydrate binding domain-containing protein [bacterium]